LNLDSLVVLRQAGEEAGDGFEDGIICLDKHGHRKVSQRFKVEKQL
jgi:hypothetical protein